MDMSFLQFSRLTPRERMMLGLRGHLAPTFGLELGSPRGQLGVIPTRGLGYTYLPKVLSTQNITDEQGLNSGVTTITSLTATPTSTLPTANTTVAPTSSFMAPKGTIDASAFTAPTTTAAGPTVVVGEVSKPPSDGGGVTNDAGGSNTNDTPEADDSRDSYDYSGEDGTPDDASKYQTFTSGDEEGGSGGDSPAVYNHDTFANQQKAIKAPSSGLESTWQSVKPYLPWVVGGGALLGLAFMMGKRKR